MNLADAEALLGELADATNGAHVEVGTHGRPPRTYAYLKLTSVSDRETCATISTPGDGWFELEVQGGFSIGRTSDLTPDDWVKETLEKYVGAAIAYLDGRWSSEKSRLFGVPFVLVRTDDGPLRLTLSAPETLRHIVKRTGPLQGRD